MRYLYLGNITKQYFFCMDGADACAVVFRLARVG